jgi:hypothetical protein
MPRERRNFESPEEIGALLEVVSEKVPSMIKGIMESFFSPQAAANVAKSVTEFRKTLIEGGISEEEAMKMTREYLRTLTNWKGMFSEAKIGEHHYSAGTQEE